MGAFDDIREAAIIGPHEATFGELVRLQRGAERTPPFTATRREVGGNAAGDNDIRSIAFFHLWEFAKADCKFGATIVPPVVGDRIVASDRAGGELHYEIQAGDDAPAVEAIDNDLRWRVRAMRTRA